MTMYLRACLGRGFAALGLLPLLALAACNNDPQSGGLTINYSFAQGVSCNGFAENVVDVRVDIGAGEMVPTESVACDNNGGEVVLAGVPAGNYDLFAYGIDDADDAVLDNLGEEGESKGEPDERVEIIGGDSKTMSVTLGLVPARLEVGLVVNNDSFPAQCSSTEIMIKGVRAEAWDYSASDQLLSHDFDLCEFDGFETVPDEDRLINGRRFDNVVIQPLDAGGNPVGVSSSLIFDQPVGAGKAARVSVVCEADACDVQLLGGDAGTTTEDPTGEDPTGEDPTGEASTGASTGGADTTAGSDTSG